MQRDFTHGVIISHFPRLRDMTLYTDKDYRLNLIMNEKKKVYFKRTESPQSELHFPNATERQVVNSKTQYSRMGSKGLKGKAQWRREIHVDHAGGKD